MARTRNLKPGFFKNEELAECSFGARLLFAGLWTLCDREGRLELKPKKIKAELFPYDAVEIPELVAELHGQKLLAVYEVDGTSYLAIPTFPKHQRPHPKEPTSVLPKPPSGATTYGKAEKKHGEPCKDTASCALPSSNPLILPSSNPDGWGEVERELLGEGVLRAREVCAALVAARCSQQFVRDVIAYWRLKSPAWGPGALHDRLLLLRPSQDYTTLWVDESVEAKQLERRKASDDKTAKADVERAARHRTRDAESKAEDLREKAYGDLLDAIELPSIRKYVADKLPALSHLVPSKRPISKGMLRNQLLLAMSRNEEFT